MDCFVLNGESDILAGAKFEMGDHVKHEHLFCSAMLHNWLDNSDTKSDSETSRLVYDTLAGAKFEIVAHLKHEQAKQQHVS